MAKKGLIAEIKRLLSIGATKAEKKVKDIYELKDYGEQTIIKLEKQIDQAIKHRENTLKLVNINKRKVDTYKNTISDLARILKEAIKADNKIDVASTQKRIQNAEKTLEMFLQSVLDAEKILEQDALEIERLRLTKDEYENNVERINLMIESKKLKLNSVNARNGSGGDDLFNYKEFLERFDELDAGLDAKIQIAEENNSTEAMKAKYGIDVAPNSDETPDQMLERLNKQYS